MVADTQAADLADILQHLLDHAPEEAVEELEDEHAERLSHRARMASAGNPWMRYEGKRGGHGWRNSETGDVVYQDKQPGNERPRAPHEGGQPAPKRKAQPNPEAIAETRTHIEGLRSSGKPVNPEMMAYLARRLMGHTVAELRELKRSLNLKASGNKFELAQKMAERSLIEAKAPTEKPPAKEKAKKDEETGAGGMPKTPDIGQVYNVDPKELSVDPTRFQYKLNTNNPEGVTQELKGVRTWNPDFAGVVSVWRDPENGKSYVVNGHHRHELAGRTGAKDMAVRYVDAKTAKEARAVGALINIAEGRGTAIDAAKFMRDTGVQAHELESRGVSLRGKVAADAQILTNLSDHAFNMLAQGRLDEGKALAVAKHLINHDKQDQLFRILEKREDSGKDISGKVIEEMAREMAATPTTIKSENTLFGNIESEESLFVERAEVKAYVRSEMAKEVNDFLAVSSKRRAERVGKAGNVLDVEENRKIAEKADQAKNVFDTLVNRKGGISDSINEAAAEYAAAKTKRDRDAIRQRAVDRVKQAVLGEIGLGGEGEDSGRSGPASDAQPPAPSETPPADAGRGKADAAELKPKAKEPAQDGVKETWQKTKAEVAKPIFDAIRSQLESGTKIPVPTALGGFNIKGPDTIRMNGSHIEVFGGKRKGADQWDRLPDDALDFWGEKLGLLKPRDHSQSVFERHAKNADLPPHVLADFKSLTAKPTTVEEGKHPRDMTEEEYDEAQPFDIPYKHDGRADLTKKQVEELSEKFKSDPDNEYEVVEDRDHNGRKTGRFNVFARPKYEKAAGKSGPASPPPLTSKHDEAELAHLANTSMTAADWKERRLDDPTDANEEREKVQAAIRDGQKVPRELLDKHKDIVQSHLNEKAQERGIHNDALDELPVGGAGYAGGWFTRRTGPHSWRIETESGHIEGDKAQILEHVANHQKSISLEGRGLREAKERFKNAPEPSAASGGGLTGSRKEDFDRLKPVLEKRVDNEISLNRKALVARELIRGNPPAVQKALADLLKQIDPDTHAYIEKNLGQHHELTNAFAANAPHTGGGLFGGEDVAGAAGFNALPNGARVLITEGGHAGRVGTINKELDESGRPSTKVKLDGSPGLVNVRHSAVEPLDRKHSWRVPKSSQPTMKTGSLF